MIYFRKGGIGVNIRPEKVLFHTKANDSRSHLILIFQLSQCRIAVGVDNRRPENGFNHNAFKSEPLNEVYCTGCVNCKCSIAPFSQIVFNQGHNTVQKLVF